ncbi:beta-propeller fold lactonase family protein [Streptomyces mirabilis]|uniref:YVTN family beta-propeller repeat protein n=1 Tax=Streptomyces mirabilis TaxID=68239 RepID=UPI0036A5ACD9
MIDDFRCHVCGRRKPPTVPQPEVPVIRREKGQTGPHRGTGPKNHGQQPWPWAAWLRVCTAALAVLAGLALPVVTPSPARAATNGNAYVANYTAGTVTVIDTTTNTPVTTVTVGTNPDSIAITPDNAHAYVSNRSSNTVSVIDTTTNTVSTTITGFTGGLQGIAIAPDGLHAYVITFSGLVYVIDTTTNMVATTITLPSSADPRFLAITPDSKFVYVTELGLGQVQVIDATTNTISTTITGFTQPTGIAITPDGSFAYVADFGTNTVSVIDTATNTVVGSPITVGNAPYGLAITPDGTQVYVSNVGDQTVTAIDTTTNTPTATIGVGVGNYKLAVTPDSKHVYVTNFNDSSVSVIDTATNTVSTTITGIVGPFGDAIAAGTATSLNITKTHTGHFTQGERGTYTITVGNTGPGPTNGSTVTVHDILPAGLTATHITGTGWSCTRSTLTCTRSDVLPAGSSYPPITLRVRISCAAAFHVTNTATATGGGDSTTHTATDPTTIRCSERCHRHEHDRR